MDSDLIDLTEESKCELNKSGLETVDDSRYAPIEDSRYTRIDDSRYARIEDTVVIGLDDEPLADSRYARIDDPTLCDNEISVCFNDENDDAIFESNAVISSDRSLNAGLSSSAHRAPTSPEDAYRARSFQSSPPSSQQHHSADNRLLDFDSNNLHRQPNRLSSANSPIQIIDDDDIHELDNELSILAVVTPKKQLNSSNRSSNPSSNTPSNLLGNRSSSRLSNSPLSTSPYIPLTFDSPGLTSTVSPKVIASSIDPTRLITLKRNLVETSFNQEILIADPDDEEEEPAPFDVNKRKQKRRAKLSDEEKVAKQAEKEAKQAEKERKKAERAELNRQKEKLKVKERRLKEANRHLNLKNSYQHCTTIVAQTLIDRYLTNEDSLRTAFESANPERKLNLEIDKDCALPMVRWKRVVHTRNDQLIADRSVLNLSEILSKDEIEEEQLIRILSKEQFVKMVYKFVLAAGEAPEEPFEFDENDPENISLADFVCRQIAVHGKSILFIVYSLEAYYRTLKNREHRDFLQIMNDDQATSRSRRAQKPKLPVISRANVEEAVLNCSLELMKNDTFVELKLKVRFQFAENQSDLIHQIYNLSSSMADAPYRRWKSAQQGFDWFADGDCKSGSVNLKELPEDAARLWIKHLLLFDKVSLPVAKAIAQKYPYLTALKCKYDSLDEVKDKESLLCQIALPNGGRTINADISRRIYKFLTEANEDEMLV